jgi:CheY-like chemotaxis protein
MTNQNVILAVDDQPITLATVADILQDAGYDVLTASNGLEALQLMEDHTPDLIVSDIMMPEMDGYQFYEAVRANTTWRLIPFIFLTAQREQDFIRRGYSLGADLYLIKPIDVEDLLLAVETRLKRITDIQIAAREEAGQANKEQIKSLGHELFIPLSFVYSNINKLQNERDVLSRKATNEVLNNMQRGTERLATLIEELMSHIYSDGDI